MKIESTDIRISTDFFESVDHESDWDVSMDA